MNAISIAAASGWKLNDAEIRIHDGDRSFEYAGHRSLEDGVEVSFIPSLDSPTEGEPGRTLEMTLKYPAAPPIQVVLIEDQTIEGATPAKPPQSRFPLFGPGLGGVIQARDSQRLYRIQEIEVDGLRLSLRQPLDSADDIRVLKPVRPEDSGTTRG
jgi:hypothetical protein